MFTRVVPPVPVEVQDVVIKRPVEVVTDNGVDIRYTDKEEALPPYDSYSVESLSAAGVPLKAVNPAILDSVDVAAVNEFVSRESAKAEKAEFSSTVVEDNTSTSQTEPVTNS
ncbi:M16p6 [Microviridae IME-16]|uniref:M16p6 n=1 Tax=Microviridae IME-16 TaxID=1544364 RepID=UPI0004F900EB|nr:M16p6 [Microviridae IME-16]AIN52147.1 M16p6 [Microviridae IME-16]